MVRCNLQNWLMFKYFIETYNRNDFVGISIFLDNSPQKFTNKFWDVAVYFGLFKYLIILATQGLVIF